MAALCWPSVDASIQVSSVSFLPKTVRLIDSYFRLEVLG